MDSHPWILSTDPRWDGLWNPGSCSKILIEEIPWQSGQNSVLSLLGPGFDPWSGLKNLQASWQNKQKNKSLYNLPSNFFFLAATQLLGSLFPDQGVHMRQLKILPAAIKTWHSQMNTYIHISVCGKKERGDCRKSSELPQDQELASRGRHISTT